MRIIVVDDEINALNVFLGQIITNQQVEYRFFKDDPEAILKYCRSNYLDGAFLDISMPNINGFDLARKIVEIVPDIKISFITGLVITNADIPDDLKKNTIGIIYKPYKVIELERHLNLFGERKQTLVVKMFGSFECFMNGRVIAFTSSKSKELFALLLALRGKSLSMGDAITALWPDKDLDKSKRLYRDAVWRLRETLNEINFPCVTFGRAILTLDTQNIECDYYDFMAGKGVYYNGEFLTSYEWSLPFQDELDFYDCGR
jgi:two-component SAPR family response regulator